MDGCLEKGLRVTRAAHSNTMDLNFFVYVIQSQLHCLQLYWNVKEDYLGTIAVLAGWA